MIEKNNENIYKLVSIGYFLRIECICEDLIFSDQTKELINILSSNMFVNLLIFIEKIIDNINNKNISLQAIEDLEYVLRVRYEESIRLKSIRESDDKKEARKQKNIC